MARAESGCPLARAEACVTWPSSFDPFGMTVFPSDLTASVVCALTVSPGVDFLESRGEVKATLNAVPLASPALACPFCAAADAELDVPACACVFPAWTDVCPLACAPACAPVCD